MEKPLLRNNKQHERKGPSKKYYMKKVEDEKTPA